MTILYTAKKKALSAFTSAFLLHTLSNPSAYGTGAGDNFGVSSATNGSVVAIGALNEDDANGTSSGKVYLFDAATGSLLHTLNNPNAYGTSANDQFGYSMDMSGNILAVGAHQEDEAGMTDSGKVYLFDVTTGSLLRTINNPNAYNLASNDYFGNSVAISGNRVAIGAYGEGDPGGAQSGKVYIFDVTTGGLLTTLSNPNVYSTSAGDTFGYSVSMSGDLLIASAHGEDEFAISSSGKAYIFNLSTGTRIHTLSNPNAYSTKADDNFGLHVSISSKYAVIGTPNEDASTSTDSGRVYVFNVTTGALIRTINNPHAGDAGTGTPDHFGRFTSISGDYVAITAYGVDEASNTDTGKAYIFNLATGALVATLDNPNPHGTPAADFFGRMVSFSGNTLVVTSASESDSSGTGSGKAYVYTLS